MSQFGFKNMQHNQCSLINDSYELVLFSKKINKNIQQV